MLLQSSLHWAAQELLVTCPEYVGRLGQPLLPESAVCVFPGVSGVEMLCPRTTNAAAVLDCR